MTSSNETGRAPRSMSEAFGQHASTTLNPMPDRAPLWLRILRALFD